MAKRTIYPPDMDDLLAALKNNIFATLNCINVGKINSYDTTTQSAKIELQMKRVKEDGTLVDYPLLTDCPVIVLGGGGTFLDFPITAGDYCLVFFNDRNIDDWWTTGNVKEPKTKRKHNLSDGFALVGINTQANPFSLDGTKVVLNGTGKEVDIKGTKLNMLGATEAFLKGTTWQTNWTTFNSNVQAASPGNEAANKQAIEDIQSAFSTFAAQLANMLSLTIKGE